MGTHRVHNSRDGLVEELFYGSAQAEAFDDYVTGHFAYATQPPDEAAGNYYRDKVAAGLVDDPGLPPLPLIDRRERALAIVAELRAQTRAGDMVDGLLHDGRDPGRDRRRIDDRRLEDLDPAEPVTHPRNTVLQYSLRPFIDRRTDIQQRTLVFRYWLGLTIRETSEAMGSVTSRNVSGAAQSNDTQARKMLQKELLAAFAPDDDPDDVPEAVTLHRYAEGTDAQTGRIYPVPDDPNDRHDPGPRWRSTYDRPEGDVPLIWPDPAPVRVRHIDPEPKRWLDPTTSGHLWLEDQRDLRSMESWEERGFVSGPPDERRTPGEVGFVDRGTAARVDPAGNPGQLAAPPRTDDRGWRQPFPRKTPNEQAVADYLDWAPDTDRIADLMRRAPNDTDRGAGFVGIGPAFRNVLRGLGVA